MLLLGHRGARNYAPENTLPALQLALDHGCDGFEFDARLTSDQQVVICHDPKFGRLTVERSTRTQLAMAPALEEVLDSFSRSAFLNIELKVTGIEACTAESLNRFPAAKG